MKTSRAWHIAAGFFFAVTAGGLVVAVSRLHQPELCPLPSLYLGIGGPLTAAVVCYLVGYNQQLSKR